MRAWPVVLAAVGCATPSPTSFELDLGGRPAAVAVKTDDGAWTKLTAYAIAPLSTGYQIPFADTLDIMIACTPNGTATIHEVRTTREELDATLTSWSRPSCLAPTLGSKITGHVHTSALPASLQISAWFAGWTEIDATDYDFSFPVDAQVVDFAAWNDTHIAVRTGLDLRSPLTLPTIDLDHEATLIAGTVAYDPLPPEMTMTGQVGIHTQNGLDVAWDTPAGSPRVVPYGVLAAGDVQWVSIEGATDSRYQRFTGELGAEFPDRVSFLPLISGVADEGTAVTWRPFIDQFTTELMECGDRVDGTYAYDVTESVGWAMAHGNGRIALDLDAPGLPAFTQQIGDCTLEVQRRLPGNQIVASGIRSL
jgi:hypothetical protein